MSEEMMSDEGIAKEANDFARIPGVKVTARDAELARKVLGLVLGRPFDHRHAIAPSRVIAAYRMEVIAAEKVRLFDKLTARRPRR